MASTFMPVEGGIWRINKMAYLQTASMDASDRIDAKHNDARMPYYLAVPIWITLAIVAWSPLLLLFNAVSS